MMSNWHLLRTRWIGVHRKVYVLPEKIGLDVGREVARIAGGAIIPKLFAALKDVFDFQQTFCLIMLPCYMYILFYAIKGHTIGR